MIQGNPASGSSLFGNQCTTFPEIAFSYSAICRTFSGESANFLYCLGWVDIYEREIFWVCALFLAVISVRNPWRIPFSIHSEV